MQDDNRLFSGLTMLERINKMNATADESQDHYSYTYQFNEDELTELRTVLADTDISIDDVETQIKSLLDDLKTQKKALLKVRKRVLSAIRNKSEFKTEKAWGIANLDRNEVEYFNANGDKIGARKIRQGEGFQSSIFNQAAMKDAV